MKRPDASKANVDFLFEMGTLRFIQRMWQRFLNADVANLAEHHFRMFWIAQIIATQEGADTAKVAKMVMVHDIAESRTGDVDYLARQYVVRNEKLGIQDMLAGTSLEKEYFELWQEYEDRKTLEAKIVKDADNLDVDFEIIEQASKGFAHHDSWHTGRQFVADEKLYTLTAKKLFAQLQKGNPHDWHANGRNRLNDGDWKK